MTFNRLVTPPQWRPGGISFVLDHEHGDHTVYIADDFIVNRLDRAGSADDRLRWVMTHIPELVEIAEEKAKAQSGMPQFVVIGSADFWAG